MLNQVVLVGRLSEDPVLNSTDKGKQVMTVNLAVPRSFKNSEGVYETDFIRCVLWNGIAESTSEYCHKGDIVGVKGRIQMSSYVDKNEKKQIFSEVIAEKVTFLSSKKEEKADE